MRMQSGYSVLGPRAGPPWAGLQLQVVALQQIKAKGEETNTPSHRSSQAVPPGNWPCAMYNQKLLVCGLECKGPSMHIQNACTASLATDPHVFPSLNTQKRSPQCQQKGA